MTQKEPGTGPTREPPHLVKIEINDKTFEVPPGPTPVAQLKALAGVPPTDDLNVVREKGRLEPLPDDGTVVVREHMKFISTPKSGGAS